MMEDIEFHFIELKKLRHSIAELEDPLEVWTAFIRLPLAKRSICGLSKSDSGHAIKFI
jgi:hypothetical protein